MSTRAPISEIDVDRPPAGTECCSCRAVGHFCAAARYINQTDLGICEPCRNGEDCEVAKKIRSGEVETATFEPEAVNDYKPSPGKVIPKEEWPADTSIHETKHNLAEVPFGMRSEIRAEQRGLPKPVPINDACPPKQQPVVRPQPVVDTQLAPSVELCGCGRPTTHRGRCAARRLLGVKKPAKPRLPKVTLQPEVELVSVAATALAEMERAVAEVPKQEEGSLYERALKMVEDDLAETIDQLERLAIRKENLERCLPSIKTLIEYEDKLR